MVWSIILHVPYVDTHPHPHTDTHTHITHTYCIDKFTTIYIYIHGYIYVHASIHVCTYIETYRYSHIHGYIHVCNGQGCWIILRPSAVQLCPWHVPLVCCCGQSLRFYFKSANHCQTRLLLVLCVCIWFPCASTQHSIVYVWHLLDSGNLHFWPSNHCDWFLFHLRQACFATTVRSQGPEVWPHLFALVCPPRNGHHWKGNPNTIDPNVRRFPRLKSAARSGQASCLLLLPILWQLYS